MIPLGILAAAGGAVAAADSYDLLATEILTSSQSSIEFTSLNSTYGADYEHLQIRYTVRHATSGGGVDFIMRLNSDSSTNYSWHLLYGNGSSVASISSASASSMFVGQVPRSGETANGFQVGVIDVLDAFETTKYSTIRTLTGRAQSGNIIGLASGSWRNTDAITSVTLLGDSGDLAQYSRFSLYGIRKAA